MSDVPRPLKQEMPRYREVEEQLLQVIYKKFLGSSLTDEEAQRLKEIDEDLLWYDLAVLLEEKQPGDAPKLHFELDYTVRPFVEVEQEYLEMFQKLSEIIKRQIFTRRMRHLLCRNMRDGRFRNRPQTDSMGGINT